MIQDSSNKLGQDPEKCWKQLGIPEVSKGRSKGKISAFKKEKSKQINKNPDFSNSGE